MSLHVQLSPEAIAKLESQKRSSTIMSWSMSFLVIIFIGFILTFFLIPTLSDPGHPEPVHPWRVDINDPPIEKPLLPSVSDRKPTPPSHAKSPIISAHTLSLISVPTPDLDVATPTLEFGQSDDFGRDYGNEMGIGYSNLPTPISKRCSLTDRLSRLKEMGGTKECDDAVIKALDWLQSNQSANGSWPAPGTKSGGKIRAVAPQFTSNEVYRVCINTLMLEVYYRFLPGTGSL